MLSRFHRLIFLSNLRCSILLYFLEHSFVTKNAHGNADSPQNSPHVQITNLWCFFLVNQIQPDSIMTATSNRHQKEREENAKVKTFGRDDDNFEPASRGEFGLFGGPLSRNANAPRTDPKLSDPFYNFLKVFRELFAAFRWLKISPWSL